MPHIARLPRGLENAKALLARREKAQARKELWRDTYRECYEYTMPQRETFSMWSPGQKKNTVLYDSTGQNALKEAVSAAIQQICPAWKHWASLAPGGDIDPDTAEDAEIIDLLQEHTATVFSYLNHSNFSTIIPEALFDIFVGTCALSCDEGDDDDPFVFDAIPLAVLELEEGPRGTVETEFLTRKPLARNLVRTFPGMTETDLPPKLAEQVKKKPDTEVEVVQGYIYEPKTKRYYGVAIAVAETAIIWRYDYETSSPIIVARSSVTSGEIYGRGRVMDALPDIKTLNTMQEFVLRHSAFAVAPPLTGVTDGVLNPYTAALVPNSIIPVASNDNGNPSLKPLDIGGNFAITDTIMEQLRQNVRRALLGPDMSEGPIKSATEIAIADRNRLWSMGAEYGRIQAELLSKIIGRCVWILQKRGILPPLKVDGRQVTLKYVSPLARAQDQEDLIALQQSLEIGAAAAAMAGEAGMVAMAAGWKLEDLPAWLSKRTGLDADLVRSKQEQKAIKDQVSQVAQQAMQQPGAQPGAAPSNVVPMRKAG